MMRFVAEHLRGTYLRGGEENVSVWHAHSGSRRWENKAEWRLQVNKLAAFVLHDDGNVWWEVEEMSGSEVFDVIVSRQKFEVPGALPKLDRVLGGSSTTDCKKLQPRMIPKYGTVELNISGGSRSTFYEELSATNYM